MEPRQQPQKEEDDVMNDPVDPEEDESEDTTEEVEEDEDDERSERQVVDLTSMVTCYKVTTGSVVRGMGDC